MSNVLSAADEARLTEIFRTILEKPSLELVDTLTAPQVPGWDSFNHVNLVMEVEEEFGVRFSTEEIASLANVGEFKKLIASKLASR